MSDTFTIIIVYGVVVMMIIGYQGVRDGAEGIGDIFIALAWPLVVAFFLATFPYWIGRLIRRIEDDAELEKRDDGNWYFVKSGKFHSYGRKVEHD